MIEPSCASETSKTFVACEMTFDGAVAVLFKNSTLCIFCLCNAAPVVVVIPKNALVCDVSELASFNQLNNDILVSSFVFADKSATAPSSITNCIFLSNLSAIPVTVIFCITPYCAVAEFLVVYNSSSVPKLICTPCASVAYCPSIMTFTLSSLITDSGVKYLSVAFNLTVTLLIFSSLIVEDSTSIFGSTKSANKTFS